MIDAKTLKGRASRAGFTLVELLVVILIILLVSAVTLPAIVSAMSHRQVSEAARILQAALVGARDTAIHNNAISGIRLLPDPTLNGVNSSTGQLDITQPLAMNRIVPLDAAPDYNEGMVSIIKDGNLFSPFPANPGWYYPYPYPTDPTQSVRVLMVEECPIDPKTFLPNEPTSWFWNIRIGDKIRIGNVGQYYTVIGPMSHLNPELFVNDGAAGKAPELVRHYNIGGTPPAFQAFNVEYLFLVNGQDDDHNGFIDNEWDGVDNDGVNGIDDTGEWTEPETWSGSLSGFFNIVNQPPNPQVFLGATAPLTSGLLNQSYNITRRPAPASGSREVALPSNVVIDLSTWATTRERSRFPIPVPALQSDAAPALNALSSQVVSPYSGSVDIVVNPDGTIVPTSIYSSPSSFGLNGAFLHFWLAERSDVIGPDPNRTAAPFLPLPAGLAPTLMTGGAEIKGDCSLVTVYSRTGQILVNSPPRFDSFTNPANGTAYNLNIPFLDAQQGVTGGNR